MKVTRAALPDVLLLEPKVFQDERGFFFESWNQRTFRELRSLGRIRKRLSVHSIGIELQTSQFDAGDPPAVGEPEPSQGPDARAA